jgi:hypothetical protein
VEIIGQSDWKMTMKLTPVPERVKKQDVVFEIEQCFFGDLKRLSFDATIGHKFEPRDDIGTPKRAVDTPLTGLAGIRRRMCLCLSGCLPN